MDYERFLSRKLESLFQDPTERAEVLSVFKTYGKEDHEKEPSRVKLAILKLAGPDIDEIGKYALIAKQDYRDVLAWAEYPRQSRKWSISDPDNHKKKKLLQEDREEYQKWLIT